MKTSFYVFILMCSVLTTKAQINSAVEKFALPESLNESSGGIFFNDKFITHNDSGGENKLYDLDTLSGNITRSVFITNAINTDWEDITQDENYIYIGDIGNNNGNRTDLKIYKVDKTDYQNSLSLNADVIAFNYDNQTDFTSNPNNTEWDAEALISFDDNHLILFSKNWVDGETSAYLIPKAVGNHSITALPTTLPNSGLITGGTFNPITQRLYLIGYTKLLQPYLWSCENFSGNDIFSGTNNQTFLTNFGFEQTEAITYVNANRYLISSESFSFSNPFPVSNYAKLIAFNEIPLGNAQQLSIIQQPHQQNCDGSLNSSIEVQLEDHNGNPVNQSGFSITAGIVSGFGELHGTIYESTDTNGRAIFDDLEFTVNDNHIIRFTFPDLNDAVSSEIEAASNCNAVFWTGQLDDNWNNVGNWIPQEIPDENYEVILPSGIDIYPILSEDASVGDLIMESDSSIDLNGFTLNLNGSLNNIENTAQIDASTPSSELYLSALIPQTISSDFICPEVSNLTIDNPEGVTLNSEISVTEVLSVLNGNLITNDSLTLSCSFSPRQSAQIDNLQGSISGKVIVEQCFDARRAFRLLSPSTTTNTSIKNNWQEGVNNIGIVFPEDNLNPNPGFGTHITGSSFGDHGFDASPSGNPALFSYDHANQSWDGLGNTNTNTLTAGTPLRLMIRGDRSIDITSTSAAPTPTKLRSKGTIAKGPVTTPWPAIDLANQFVFKGNPFQAQVDMEMVLNATNDLSQNYVVWDPNLGGTAIPGQPGGRGAYVTINVADNKNSNSDSAFDKYLQPSQAFFIKTLTNTPSLTFQESHKRVDNIQTQNFYENTSPHFISIKLYDDLSYSNNDTSDDGLVIYFSSNWNNSVNNQDAIKFFNIDENIARVENNHYLSYEKRALPTDAEVLSLFLSQYRSPGYTFEVEIGDFQNQNLVLYDKHSDMETTLSQNSINTYSFSVDESIPESIASDRFELKFEGNLDLNNFERQDLIIFPNPVDDKLNIKWNTEISAKKDIAIYNINGKLIDNYKIIDQNSKGLEIDVSTFNTGIYFIKIMTEDNHHYHYIKKFIIE